MTKEDVKKDFTLWGNYGEIRRNLMKKYDSLEFADKALKALNADCFTERDKVKLQIAALDKKRDSVDRFVESLVKTKFNGDKVKKDYCDNELIRFKFKYKLTWEEVADRLYMSTRTAKRKYDKIIKIYIDYRESESISKMPQN